MKTLLSVPDLAQTLNVSRRTIWRMRDSGELPKPISIRGCLRWRQEVISEWLADGAPHCRKTGWKHDRAGRE
jgi:predicted DNA-binding transcriptional regulator AlpA